MLSYHITMWCTSPRCQAQLSTSFRMLTVYW